MARGFLSGLIWGGVASLGVMGALSLTLPLPVPPQVGDAAPGAGPQPAHIRLSDVAEQDRLPETPPAGIRLTPQTDAPAQDDLAALGPEAQTPAGQPETGTAEGLRSPDNTPGETPAQPQAEDPVLAPPQSVAPQTPQPVDELSISTEPSQPPAPEVAGVQGAFDAPGGFESPEPAESAELTLPAQEGERQTDAPAPAEDEAPAASAQGPAAGTSRPRDSAADAATSDAPPEAMVEEPQAPAPPVAEDDRSVQAPDSALRPPETEPSGNSGSDAQDSTVTEASENPQTARPGVGTPAASLTERSSVVVVNRPASSAAEVETDTTPTEAETDPRPVVANSVAVEVPADKPLMSVVLIDDGSTVSTGPAGLAALRSFPYPLTFAVDSDLPDAADRVARYRDAGFEVMALVDLPPGAQPADAETSLAVTLDALDGIVGVLEGTEGGLQGNRAVADQVSQILAQSGHGLVTQDKGLNTMPKLARKNGVPADPVFRDFDSKDQSARVIRRFLDQAAFKAGQEGAVIMLGRLRPDTVSALLLWGLQDRAGDVALVPVSAVLLRD